MYAPPNAVSCWQLQRATRGYNSSPRLAALVSPVSRHIRTIWEVRQCQPRSTASSCPTFHNSLAESKEMGRLKIHNSLFTDYCIVRRKHTAFTSRDCTTNAILKFHNRSCSSSIKKTYGGQTTVSMFWTYAWHRRYLTKDKRKSTCRRVNIDDKAQVVYRGNTRSHRRKTKESRKTTGYEIFWIRK